MWPYTYIYTCLVYELYLDACSHTCLYTCLHMSCGCGFWSLWVPGHVDLRTGRSSRTWGRYYCTDDVPFPNAFLQFLVFVPCSLFMLACCLSHRHLGYRTLHLRCGGGSQGRQDDEQEWCLPPTLDGAHIPFSHCCFALAWCARFNSCAPLALFYLFNNKKWAYGFSHCRFN